MPIASSRQTVSNLVQWNFFTSWPAKKRPAASDKAKMLAICTLKVSESASTWWLNVGSHVMMPCSTITNKNALNTKKITKGSAISLIMPIKSSATLPSLLGTSTSILENSSSKKASATSPASKR